ncbi:MAG: hypothetical protein ACU83N_00005 [Gammaproteobacteria bacterium]
MSVNVRPGGFRSVGFDDGGLLTRIHPTVDTPYAICQSGSQNDESGNVQNRRLHPATHHASRKQRVKFEIEQLIARNFLNQYLSNSKKLIKADKTATLSINFSKIDNY